MYQQKFSISSIVINLIIFASLMVLSVAAVINRQYIMDQFSVWQYQTSPEVDALVVRAGMNDYGQFLYHASRPVLEGTQAFNSECNRVEITVSILGCYSSNRIYVYDVDDQQLDGIREVTAAHETLHAAYARLSTVERERVNGLLSIEYEKIKNAPEFADRLAFYSRAEPGEKYNELHSIIGTEVVSLNTDLEDYYSRYFRDRQKVVELNATYSSVFKDLKDRADILSTQLDALAESIQSQTDSYNASVLELNRDIVSFNARASKGDFSSEAEFYEARNDLVSRADAVDVARDAINSDIARYDELLNEYNAIAIQTTKLYDTIDSTLAPAPSV
jgi:hypothetical protein